MPNILYAQQEVNIYLSHAGSPTINYNTAASPVGITRVITEDTGASDLAKPACIAALEMAGVSSAAREVFRACLANDPGKRPDAKRLALALDG